MADVAAIRAGLKANLDSVGTAIGAQVSAYVLSELSPPFIVVMPASVEFDKTAQRGEDDFEFQVFAAVPFSADIASQTLFDQMMAGTGAKSIKTAIESDHTLGGAAQDVWVSRISDYGVFTRPTGDVLGAQFHVTVIGTNP